MDNCNICKDEMTAANSYKIECGHRFHTACIIKWFRTLKTDCPNCRSTSFDGELLKSEIKLCKFRTEELPNTITEKDLEDCGIESTKYDKMSTEVKKTVDNIILNKKIKDRYNQMVKGSLLELGGVYVIVKLSENTTKSGKSIHYIEFLNSDSDIYKIVVDIEKGVLYGIEFPIGNGMSIVRIKFDYSIELFTKTYMVDKFIENKEIKFFQPVSRFVNNKSTHFYLRGTESSRYICSSFNYRVCGKSSKLGKRWILEPLSNDDRLFILDKGIEIGPIEDIINLADL